MKATKDYEPIWWTNINLRKWGEEERSYRDMKNWKDYAQFIYNRKYTMSVWMTGMIYSIWRTGMKLKVYV